jgi:hypothetical protein
VIKALIGLFIDDEFLAAAILIVVAAVAALALSGSAPEPPGAGTFQKRKQPPCRRAPRPRTAVPRRPENANARPRASYETRVTTSEECGLKGEVRNGEALPSPRSRKRHAGRGRCPPGEPGALKVGVGTGSPGTFSRRCCLDGGLVAWRNAMLQLFVNPSPLLVAGEVLVGLPLPMFVAALVVTFGDRIRHSVGR